MWLWRELTQQCYGHSAPVHTNKRVFSLQAPLSGLEEIGIPLRSTTQWYLRWCWGTASSWWQQGCTRWWCWAPDDSYSTKIYLVMYKSQAPKYKRTPRTQFLIFVCVPLRELHVERLFPMVPCCIPNNACTCICRRKNSFHCLQIFEPKTSEVKRMMLNLAQTIVRISMERINADA